MGACEPLKFLHSVGHLTAYGVVAFKTHSGNQPLFYLTDYLLESIKRLGGLRIQCYRTGEINAVKFCQILDHDGFTGGLPHQSVHFGMGVLAINHNLRPGLVGRIESAFDALLQFEDHRACRIDNLYVVAPGQLIGRRRLAMSPKKHLHIMEHRQTVVFYHFQPFVGQPLHLIAVMHNIAKTIKRSGFLKFLLSLAYGGYHTETEAGPGINFNLHGRSFLLVPH